MAKKKSKKRRALATKLSTRTSAPLKIAVVTTPEGGGTLTKDLDLVRASILYADEIKLVSPAAATLNDLRRTAAAGRAGALKLMLGFDDETLEYLGGSPVPPDMRAMLPALKPYLTKPIPWRIAASPAGAVLREGKAKLSEAAAQLQAIASERIAAAGGAELMPAIRAGLIDLHEARFPGGFADVASLTTDWLETVKNIIADGRVRPLFDDRSRRIVQRLVQNGEVDAQALGLRRAGEASVGTGLIDRLPTLTGVPLDELIDLRSDLAVPLGRFRAATAKFATELDASPLDEEFPARMEDLWRNTVHLEIQAIEDLFEEHGLVREARRAAASAMPGLVGSSSVWIGLGAFTELKEWLLGLAAAAGPAAVSLANGFRQRHEALRAAEQREMFFLFEVDRQLELRSQR